MTDIWKQNLLNENKALKAENILLRNCPKQAIETLKQAFKEEPDFAHIWHCNLACAAIDEGVKHPISSAIASRFMKLAFDVETEG